MSINENQINKFKSEKSISKIINKSRNLKKLNTFNTIGYISNSTKLPNLSILKGIHHQKIILVLLQQI